MKPHKHAELIKAWADGAEIEYKAPWMEEWKDCYNTPDWYFDFQYRIKPEPKPDFMEAIWSGKQECWVEIVWDGETGELKDAEVLK